MRGIKIPYALIFIAMALLLWEGLVRIGQLPGWLLPAPGKVVLTLVQMAPLLAEHARYTLVAAGTGLLAAIVVALIIAVFSPHYQDDAARWGEQKSAVWSNY